MGIVPPNALPDRSPPPPSRRQSSADAARRASGASTPAHPRGLGRGGGAERGRGRRGTGPHEAGGQTRTRVGRMVERRRRSKRYSCGTASLPHGAPAAPSITDPGGARQRGGGDLAGGVVHVGGGPQGAIHVG